MTTPYVDIVDARIDPDSPGDFNLTTDIRNNFRYFKELTDLIGIFAESNIYDEFSYKTATLNAAIWDSGNSSTGSAPTHVATAGSHYVELIGNTDSNAGSSGIAAGDKKLRCYLGIDQRLVMETRTKIAAAGSGGRRLTIGLQDASLATGVATLLTDVTDFVGFIQGTNSNTVKLICAKAGTTSAGTDNQGVLSAWSRLKIDIMRSSGAFTIRGYIDDVEVGGSPLSTNVPDATVLRPVLVCGNDTGSGTHITMQHDRALAYWVNRPDSP